jgi:two-component system sensor histidine kinase/response regulator
MNSPPRLLLVDDIPDNLALLEAILAPEGYDLAMARSGEEALRLVQRDAPDLVLLDVLMPGMDGFAVCRNLRERLKTRFVPVIMITALNEIEDRIRGLEAGAYDFIAKPFSDDLLIAKIRSLLRLKQMRDEVETQRADFTNMIVHDLRAPVHSILGLAELLRESLDGDAQALRLLELLEKSARKIERLTIDYLDFSRIETGQLKLNTRPTDLVPLAAAVVEQFRPVGRSKELRFVLDAPADPLVLDVDAERLDQVFANLLQNAVKFSPVGGTITLVLRPVPAGARILVEDEGPGLPEDERQAIFEKYVQRDARHGGVGLGLYVCKAVITAHGGTIRAENRPGGGARFILDLTRDPAPTPAAPANPKEEA